MQVQWLCIVEKRSFFLSLFFSICMHHSQFAWECQKAGWIQKFKWMLTPLLKMQSLCFGRNQKVLHLAHRRCVLAEIMLGLVLLSQTRSQFQNNGEMILPILQITLIWESLHGHKVFIRKVLSRLTWGQIERRRLKKQGVGPDNSQRGQVVACMGEKQSNSSWSVNTVIHDKRWSQSIQSDGLRARLVRPNYLKLTTGTKHGTVARSTCFLFQILQSICVTQESQTLHSAWQILVSFFHCHHTHIDKTNQSQKTFKEHKLKANYASSSKLKKSNYWQI